MENNHPVLQQLKDRIDELEKEIEERKQQSRQRASDIVANEEKLKEILVEGINDSEITNEFAQSIADIFGIELLRNVAISLVFHVEASLQVPYGADLDELAEEVGIETKFYGKAGDYLDYDTWELYDYSVEEA